MNNPWKVMTIGLGAGRDGADGRDHCIHPPRSTPPTSGDADRHPATGRNSCRTARRVVAASEVLRAPRGVRRGGSRSLMTSRRRDVSAVTVAEPGRRRGGHLAEVLAGPQPERLRGETSTRGRGRRGFRKNSRRAAPARAGTLAGAGASMVLADPGDGAKVVWRGLARVQVDLLQAVDLVVLTDPAAEDDRARPPRDGRAPPESAAGRQRPSLRTDVHQRPDDDLQLR